MEGGGARGNEEEMERGGRRAPETEGRDQPSVPRPGGSEPFKAGVTRSLLSRREELMKQGSDQHDPGCLPRCVVHWCVAGCLSWYPLRHPRVLTLAKRRVELSLRVPPGDPLQIPR